MGSVDEPRQLGQVHRVKIEEVTSSAHARDGHIHCMRLSWRHDAIAALSVTRLDGDKSTHRRSPG